MEIRKAVEIDASHYGLHEPSALADVSNTTVKDLITVVQLRGESIDNLLAGTNLKLEALLDPMNRISWDLFRIMCLNGSKNWTEAEIVASGRRFLRLDSIKPNLDMAFFLSEPIDCYRLFAGQAHLQSIPCIAQDLQITNRNQLRIELKMLTGMEPAPSYFLARKGALESVPVILGYPLAKVKMSTTSHGVVYEIVIVEPSGPLERLRVWTHRLRRNLIPRKRVVEVMRNLSQKFDATSDRLRALDAKLADLQRSEELFTHSFRAAPVSMFINRASDRKIIDVNDKFLLSTGYTREEAMSWTPRGTGIWANPEERDAIYEAIAECDGSVDGMEVQLLNRDGHEVSVLVSVKKVELAGELCILWQAVDISDRKRDERELARYRDQLEKLVEERTQELEDSLESLQRVERLASIGTLAAGVAHQINNPIGAIRAASQYALLCDDQPDAVEQYRQALDTCVEQADRCGRIVRNVLRFSRGEEGDRLREDLRQLVNRSCRLVAIYASECHATIDLDEGLIEIPVLANAIEIEQVLVNVLRNAIESGEKESHVSIRAQRLENEALIEIRDDGPGISPEQIPFLFDPFYTTRLKSGGTGLGLSVAHGIVTAHGGSITANLTGESGTTIEIRLPLDTTAAAASKAQT